MEDGVSLVGGQWTILNPTDPGENFADRWNPSTKEPEPRKREAFTDWLAAARRDFVELARSTSRAEIAEVMARAVGNVPVQKILERSPAMAGGMLVNRVRQFGRSILDRANHRRSPTWPVSTQGWVAISNATFTRSGFRPERIVSEGRVLEKRGSLRLEAETSVPLPYRVYWQIVNTGEQAERANACAAGSNCSNMVCSRRSRTRCTRAPTQSSAPSSETVSLLRAAVHSSSRSNSP